MGDKLIHLNQSLAVEFAADARIVGIFGIVLAEKSLSVADHAHKEPIEFDQSGVNLGAVTRTVFHMLTAVNQARQHLVEIIHGFLVKRDQMIEVFLREAGRFGLGYAKKFRLVGRHVFHIVFDTV